MFPHRSLGRDGVRHGRGFGSATDCALRHLRWSIFVCFAVRIRCWFTVIEALADGFGVRRFGPTVTVIAMLNWQWLKINRLLADVAELLRCWLRLNTTHNVLRYGWMRSSVLYECNVNALTAIIPARYCERTYCFLFYDLLTLECSRVYMFVLQRSWRFALIIFTTWFDVHFSPVVSQNSTSTTL